MTFRYDKIIYICSIILNYIVINKKVIYLYNQRTELINLLKRNGSNSLLKLILIWTLTVRTNVSLQYILNLPFDVCKKMVF